VPELEHDERLIASVAKKVRVHELAKELGLTNKEALDLCIALGIDAKSHSSSIEDAQGDRVRRRAARDGLVRAEQPAEPAPAKRTTKKAAAAAKADAPETGGGVAVAVAEPPAAEAPPVEVVDRVAEPAPVEPVVEVPAPAREEVAEAPAVVEVAPVAPVVEPEIALPGPRRPAPRPRPCSSSPEAPAPALPRSASARPRSTTEHRRLSRQAVEPEQRPPDRAPDGPPS
jgi:translation initiation factor IF-2